MRGPGPRPTLFFVPDRLRTRTREWGQAELDARMGEAWQHRFADWTATWLTVQHAEGAQAAQAAYRQVLDGRVAPDVAYTATLDSD